MVRIQKYRARLYQGIAGNIQQQLFVGILFTLATIITVTLSGMFILSDWVRNGAQIFIIAFVFAYFGSIAGYYLIKRIMAQSLEAIEQVERSLNEISPSRQAIAALNPVPGANSPKSFINAYVRLTQRLQEVETRLRETETRQLDTLAVVAHELRSPVASMVSLADLLGEEEYRQDAEYIEICQQTIVKQGRHVLQLVEDVLTAARVESDPNNLRMNAFSFSELVEEVLQEACDQHSREITYANLAGKAEVTGDALRLREVLTNLIDNALKYSPVDQPVHLSLRRIETMGSLELSVSDRGIGIAEQEMPALFTRFGRVKNERTQGIPGTGLGLYIVKNIVERHNGRIRVKSKPGEGSTFTVSLPTKQHTHIAA